MRLAHKLGFRGFVEMQFKLSAMVAAQANAAPEDWVSLGVTPMVMQYNQPALFDTIAQELMACQRFIFIYAAGFSGIIAEYMYKKLLNLGKRCLLATPSDSAGILDNNLEDIGIMLTVSRSGETHSVLDKVMMVQDQPITVISFTNEAANRLSNLADHAVKIADHNKLDEYNQHANAFFPGTLAAFEYLIQRYEVLQGR
jgi:DNA-binding MurR/RpiR family transcriptional regulator